MRLKEKVAIVTGAAQGMGLATAKLFVQSGARVTMIDINAEKLSESAEDVAGLGARPLTRVQDISDPEAVRAAVQEVHERWGRIDILVNNAAIQSPGGTFIDATEEIWSRYLAVNVKGAGYFIREVIPIMQKQSGGSIVNIGSISGFVVFPGQAVYATTKGAIQQMTKAVAVDFGKNNIRANCICPGATLSGPLARRAPSDWTEDPALIQLVNQHPLQRIAQPEDIAYAALFFASDESRHITGTILPVDGGFTAR
ncbi:MAG: SDR family oxidoreductase [Anaerolineales bacterium]|jgi:dihydroanticapsin dehydrogenase